MMDCGATPEKGGSDGKTEKEVKFACGDGDEDGSKSKGGVVDGGASLDLLTTDLQQKKMVVGNRQYRAN